MTENDVEAVSRYRKAAEQGYVPAQVQLGTMYSKSEGVRRDDQEAVKWYRKAAEQGYAGAQNSLGVMYEIGKDYQESVKWYRKAAEQRNVDAQCNLGKMYFYGWGVPKDYQESVKWYRKAAEQDSDDAQYSLGDMYFYGWGMSKDYQESMKWYRAAAEQGCGDAQYSLGHMYFYGCGVPPDYVQAHKWFNLATAREREYREIDLDEVQREKDEIEKVMTGSQVVEAQQLAREWRPRGARQAMTDKPDDEHVQDLFGALKRIENMNRKRGHEPFWHGERQFQGPMEVDAARCWAEEMNKRGHSIPICKIEGNRDDPPDVFAEMDEEKIGVEVTELVDEQAIDEHPDIPPLVELLEPGPHALDKLPQPMPPKWPLEKFERRVREIVQCKEEKVRKKHKRNGNDHSLSKQFLLIVTGEDYLLNDEATLSEYLEIIKLQRPKNFDGVYIMGSYMPDPDGEGHCPVFDVPLVR